MAWIKKRGKKWYGCWWENGKQVWKSLSTDKAVAQMKLAEIIKNSSAGKNGGLPKDIDWDEFVEKYMAYSKANKSPETISRDWVVFRHFSRDIHIQKLSELTPEILEEFKRIRREAQIQSSTINREISILKTTMKKAGEWGYVSQNVWGVRKLPEVKKRPVFYTWEDMQKLLTTADPFWKVILYLGFYAGLRKGEMLSLTWEDIDFDKRQVKITPKAWWTPKDFEAREIELHPALEEYLANWKRLCNGSQKVLPWDRPKNQLSMGFTALRKKAGLANGSMHSLRHSFASHLAMAGIDLYRIGKMMGHSSPITTQIYAHLLPSSLREAVLKLPA